MPQSIDIKQYWKKMLYSSTGRNNIPAWYLSISKNARIKDGTITKRRWYKTIIEAILTGFNQWITFNNQLLFCAENKLYKANLTNFTYTLVGSLDAANIYNFINYWKILIILTWVGKPYYYDWTTLTKTTTTAPDVNPIIWETFTWFTFIVGNTADTQNILYISRPITVEEPERAYDWVWTNAEKKPFDSKILWLSSTMNQLFIFTEKKIEYIWKDSLQTIGWIPTLITTPVWDGWELANYRCAIAAGDKILYLTKTNSINTLNFVPWTVDPWIWTLTDQPVFKITRYLENLDENQNWAFGYFDDSTKTAHWFLKTKNSLYNDTILVFDLQNNTWTTDTNKYFNDVVAVDWKIYAWDALSCNIIQDWIWLNDNKRAIEFEIQDTDISLGTIKEKMFQWRETSGWLNKLTNLEFITLIDDKESSLNYIRWIDYYTKVLSEPLPWEIWWTTVWWTSIGWLQGDFDDSGLIQFDKTLDHSYIYKRWKRIKRKISENSYWSDFYLDLYTIFADVTGNIELNDKF